MGDPSSTRALAVTGEGEVVSSFRVRCRSSRAEMWRWVADTRILNDHVGSTPLDVRRETSGATAARFAMRTRLGGVSVDYEEEPFEWDKERFFSWARFMNGGLVSSITGLYQLTDVDGDRGCEIDVRLATMPRAIVFWPIVWFIQTTRARGVAAYLRAVDDAVRADRPLSVSRAPCDLARVDRPAAELAQRHDPAVVKALVDLLVHGGDLEVQRLRPYELARVWSASREAVLRLCLDAVGAGLLELRWALLCPSCQTEADRIPSLKEIEPEGHCQLCDIRWGVELDRTVEATFAPHPSVRALDPRPFCIGGPMITPHVAAQAVARGGAPARLRVPEAPGRYRLFVRGGASAVVDVAEAKPAEAEVSAVIHAVDDAGRSVTPGQIDVAPRGQIVVHGGDAPFHAKLERAAWGFEAVTALHVSSLPEFRAQFGGEALRPGLALKVGRVALLFSDLVGSTALYAKLGDAAAFGVVNDCLHFGRKIVEKHGGTVVKTMGDAVMAAFPEPSIALAAGAEMISGWEAFAREHAGAAEVDVKVGVASGPCTIVTANGVLDYFGQTVNTAARVQHQAGPRELVVPEDLAAELPAGVTIAERFLAQVKGITEPLALVRVPPGAVVASANLTPILEGAARAG